MAWGTCFALIFRQKSLKKRKKTGRDAKQESLGLPACGCGGVASMINVKQAFSNLPLFFLFQEICGTATFLFHG
jgi:hypothetical protein